MPSVTGNNYNYQTWKVLFWKNGLMDLDNLPHKGKEYEGSWQKHIKR